MVRIQLLGRLTVEADGRAVEVPAGRTRSLLGWLALNRGSHRRSEVAARFWPDILDPSARASLRTAAWALRKALGPAADAALIATRDRVGISAGPSVWTDVSAFGELVGEDRLEEALELCCGELLADFEDDWVFEARSEHRDRMMGTLGRLATGAEVAGDLEAAVAWTRRQVDIDPLAEAEHRELMRRLAAIGDRVHAVQSYERFRGRLRRELGLVPSPATRELVASLRGEGGEPDAASSTAGDTGGGLVARAAPREPPSEGGWEPGLPFPIPPSMVSELASPFVGRDAELRRLREAFANAGDRGGARFVWLSGEAGIGKTRLLSQLAREVSAEGAITLYGVAEEEGLIACGPFVGALGHYVAVASPTELRERLGELACGLAPLLPGLSERIPRLRAPNEHASEAQLHLGLDAVTSLLGALSEEAPVLLVLDDLQWADKSSAILLRRLVASQRDVRLLVAAAYREDELPRFVHFAEALPKLGGGRFSERVRLTGLAPAEVEALCREWTGTAELSATIHAETEGNPFFVKEMLRHLDESGAERWTGRLGLPAGVRNLIALRLARLSGECARALVISAVIGREFELGVLERISNLDGDELAEVLEEAVQSGLLVEVSDAFERFRLSHALIRETLLDGLTRTRRARIHARVAETLEELHDQGDAVLPMLAYHSCEAGRAGDPDKAIDLATRAAEQATSRLAYGEAVDLYSRALRLVPDEDARRRTIMIRRAAAYMKLEHFVMVRRQGVSVTHSHPAVVRREQPDAPTAPGPGVSSRHRPA